MKGRKFFVHPKGRPSEVVLAEKRGDAWWAICPWHGEVTPSLRVDAEHGSWYCFGCEAGGRAEEVGRE
jgi:DNA primase